MSTPNLEGLVTHSNRTLYASKTRGKASVYKYRMDTLAWLDGEQARFRASLTPDEMSYYVDAAVIAPYRKAPATISGPRWRKLIAEGGYYINVLIENGPPAIALEAIAGRLDDSPDTIWPLGGALAVLGEPAIPTAIRTLERAVSNIGNGVYAKQIETAIADVQPIRSTRIAELLLDVLASKAKPKVKASARAWLVRHAAIAAPIVDKATSDPKLRTAAKAAAKALAEAT